MKYTNPVVVTTGIEPRDQSCSSPTTFTCSKNPFRCSGSFTCNGSWWKGCTIKYAVAS
ncbi:hypothetical protein IMSAGC013_01380 [Lachnospiraceae bacterium]|nr:hypothetical protein IMSAGC013_01380 [Lachnospiraceae bacterium]